MKQIILLIFIISSYTFAYEFKLNKKDIAYIKTSPKKPFIINRLNKYLKIKKKVKNYTLIRKLSHINSFVNKILPAQDIKKKGALDYWATPKEFLLQGHGDCEDYVITKYFTLLELGIDKKNLYFAIVKVKGSPTSHMVLLYFKNKKSTPLVLDNLSSKVVPLTKRKRLFTKVAFNEIDSHKLTHKGLAKKVKLKWKKENKFEKLLHRVYTLKE